MATRALRSRLRGRRQVGRPIERGSEIVLDRTAFSALSVTSRLETSVTSDEQEAEPEKPDRVARVLQIVAWTGISLFGTACGPEVLGPYANVMNSPGQPIEVYNVVDGEEEFVISIEPATGGRQSQKLFDASFTQPEECTEGDLVARTLEGEEVARLTESLCIGETWLINNDGSSEIQR